MRALVKFGYTGDFESYPLMPGLRSVEGTILEVLGRVLSVEGDPWKVAKSLGWESSSRTDSGVWARSNATSFSFGDGVEELGRRLKGAAEVLAPGGVFIHSFCTVPDVFSPRKEALYREYVFFLPWRLFPDLERATEAAELFRGAHDFSAFSKRDRSRKVSGLCSIREIELKRDDELVVMRISADRFLWNMIRRIAAAISDFSLGRVSRSELEGYLVGDGHYPNTLPPHGLMLWNVHFGADIENSLRPIASERIEKEMENYIIKERLMMSLKTVIHP